MGLLDYDDTSVLVRKPRHRSRDRSRDRSDRDTLKVTRNRSRNRSRSRARSLFGLDDSSSHRHRSSNKGAASVFSLPNGSSRSIFSVFGRSSGSTGGGHHHSSGSYYRRAPRSNFLHRAYKKLKRLLRDLVYYAKKHPLKVFMLAIMPLITGGALASLLARFGLRMPPSIERMLGVGARAMSGDHLGLVGDAMRMATGGSGGSVTSHGHGPASASGRPETYLERGRDGNLQWGRRVASSNPARSDYAARNDYNLRYGYAYDRRGNSYPGSSSGGGGGGRDNGWSDSISRFFS